MYAIIAAGGKQYRVSQNDVIYIEKVAQEDGSEISFDVLLTDIAYACPGTEYVPQMTWTGSLDINTNPSLWGRLTFAE